MGLKPNGHAASKVKYLGTFFQAVLIVPLSKMPLRMGEYVASDLLLEGPVTACGSLEEEQEFLLLPEFFRLPFSQLLLMLLFQPQSKSLLWVSVFLLITKTSFASSEAKMTSGGPYKNVSHSSTPPSSPALLGPNQTHPLCIRMLTTLLPENSTLNPSPPVFFQKSS